MPDPAVQQANQALAPILAEIRRQQAEEAKRAENAQATAGASAHGLSQVLGAIPGRIEDTYQKAGDSTSAYAKGFSAAFQQGSEQTAQQLNEFLGKQGSPQQVQAAGAKGADVLYGLGGYIPASTLAREGAAFTSAAEGLGAAALGRGQEQQALIRRDSADNLGKLDALLRQEKAKLPGLTQQFRQQDRAYELDLRQDKRAERELKLREKQAREPNLQLFGSGETGYMTFDQKTGRVVRLTQPAPAGVDPPELIGSADTGYYAWDAASGTIEPVLAAPVKPKFTDKELREFKKEAANIAYGAFWGVKGKDTNENGKIEPGEFTDPPIHYQQALAIMLDAQIPLSVAQNALNKYWKKPGQWSPVESRLAGNPGAVVWYDHRKQSAKGATGRPLRPIQERKPQGEVDPAAEAAANAYGGTTVPKGGPNSTIPGWNDKSVPPKIKNALAVAHAQIGKPYVWGAESPSEGGFDCSGLIEYAFEQAGIPTPGRLTTWSMMQLGKPVKGPLKPGDWVITNGGKHVVMYTGKGQVIAAPRRGEVVQYQPLSRFKGSIVAVRRFAP